MGLRSTLKGEREAENLMAQASMVGTGDEQEDFITLNVSRSLSSWYSDFSVSGTNYVMFRSQINHKQCVCVEVETESCYIYEIYIFFWLHVYFRNVFF